MTQADINSRDTAPEVRAAAQRAALIEALQEERRQMALFGRTDRVAAIDAELERVGAKAPAKRRAPSKSKAAPEEEPSE